jgi:TonB family protein
MRKFRIAILFFILVAFVSYAVDGGLFRVSAQTRLTYTALDTALKTKLPNQSFKTFPDLIKWLIIQVKSRKVDRPLTDERENALRQSGATDELIDAIRGNSPPLPKESPSPEVRETVVDLGELSSRATNLVKPEYTAEAIKAGIEGSVKLSLQLDQTGRVISATPLTSPSVGLTQLASAAAFKSTFLPAVVEGKAVRGSGVITYNFRLNRINVETTLTNADALRSQGNCNGAIAEYTRVITVADKDARAFAGRGVCYLIKADYENARSDFENATTIDTTDPEKFIFLAVAYDFKGDLRASAKNYEKASSLNQQLIGRPMFRCLYFDRPDITFEQARAISGDIIAACNTFMRNAPEFLTSLVFLKRGTGFRLKGDYDKAIADYESARRLNPASAAIQTQLVAAYNGRGQIYFEKKQYKAAIDDIDTAINIDPRNPTPYVNRCVINLYGWKEYDKAIEDCSTAIRLSDKSSMAFNHRGYANEMKKNLTAAFADYNKALEIDPKNELAQSNLKRIRSKVPQP